jgi:hypothetical protein
MIAFHELVLAAISYGAKAARVRVVAVHVGWVTRS